MPSILLGQPAASGAQPLISGFPWSGKANYPVGYVQIRTHPANSGNVYLGYSGGMTVNSGGFFMSGGGLLDGMVLAPGDAFAVPRLATGASGSLNIFVKADAALSGQGRIYFEIF